MSLTTSPIPTKAAAHTFDRTVADLKSGAAVAANALAGMSQKAASASSEFHAFNKGNIEAFVQAGQVFAADSQALFRDMIASSQAAAAENLVSVRALLSAKTMREQLEVQATFARTAAIRAVTETSRFVHAYIDLTEKAFVPLAERACLAADKFTTAKA